MDIDRDRIFFEAGRFEHGELAFHQTRRHKMSLPSGKPAADQLRGSLKIDQPYVVIADNLAAVGTLERRASDDAVFATPSPPADDLCDGAEPRRSIGIGERLSARHFGDIHRRVAPVRLPRRAAPAPPP